MKGTVMLRILLKGVNSSFGLSQCSGQNAVVFSDEGLGLCVKKYKKQLICVVFIHFDKGLQSETSVLKFFSLLCHTYLICNSVFVVTPTPHYIYDTFYFILLDSYCSFHLSVFSHGFFQGSEKAWTKPKSVSFRDLTQNF